MKVMIIGGTGHQSLSDGDGVVGVVCSGNRVAGGCT